MEIDVGDASPLSLLSFSSFPSFLFGDFPALLALAVNFELLANAAFPCVWPKVEPSPYLAFYAV